MHFDGSGDDGATADVRCYNSEQFAHEEREPVAYDASHLQAHFEALVPYGYEDNCGGFGNVILDVAARAITVERNDRFEDCTSESYEV